MLCGKTKMSNSSYTIKELIKDNLGNTFRYFGESENSATIAACAIAVFKGIFRPVFTLMDKKSDPETKKYTALREGLTEVAALPIYAVTPWIIKALIEKFYKGDGHTKKNIKTTGKFLGLCAATLIIPAVCNVIQPPIMNALQKRGEAKKAQVGNNQNPVNQPLQTFKGRYNVGMKVGG